MYKEVNSTVSLEGDFTYYEEQGDHVSITVDRVKLIEYLAEKFGVPETGGSTDTLYRFGRVRITIEKLYDERRLT